VISFLRLSTASPQCIHFGSIAEATAVDLTKHGVLLLAMDAKGIADKHALLVEVASQFKFPSYFSENWDSLEECLRDLSWLPASGYVLVVRDTTSIWSSAPHAVGTLIELWLSVADSWRLRTRSFHLVFEW